MLQALETLSVQIVKKTTKQNSQTRSKTIQVKSQVSIAPLLGLLGCLDLALDTADLLLVRTKEINSINDGIGISS